MPDVAASVEGLDDFRRALRAMDGKWPKALRDVHKTIADEGAQQSQRQARGMGGVKSKAAGSIRGNASEREAKIGVSGPLGAVAFWGAKRHTGWYAAPRYAESPAQHARWVGNSWDVARAGEGPYAINDALARYLPYLLDDYEHMVFDLAREAFPE